MASGSPVVPVAGAFVYGRMEKDGMMDMDAGCRMMDDGFRTALPAVVSETWHGGHPH